MGQRQGGPRLQRERGRASHIDISGQRKTYVAVQCSFGACPFTGDDVKGRQSRDVWNRRARLSLCFSRASHESSI